MPEFWVRDISTWRQIVEVFAYDGATWRNCTEVWAYDGSTWRLVFGGDCSGTYTGPTSCTGAFPSQAGQCSGVGSCNQNTNFSATWSPDSTCSDQHINARLSVNGGSFVSKNDTLACSATVWTFNYIVTFQQVAMYNSVSPCNSDCGVLCAGQNFKWNLRLEDDGTHVVCRECTTSTSPSRYVCQCGKCDPGGP